MRLLRRTNVNGFVVAILVNTSIMALINAVTEFYSGFETSWLNLLIIGFLVYIPFVAFFTVVFGLAILMYYRRHPNRPLYFLLSAVSGALCPAILFGVEAIFHLASLLISLYAINAALIVGYFSHIIFPIEG